MSNVFTLDAKTLNTKTRTIYFLCFQMMLPFSSNLPLPLANFLKAGRITKTVGKAIAMSMDSRFLEDRERRHAKDRGLRRPICDISYGLYGNRNLTKLIILYFHSLSRSHTHFFHFLRHFSNKSAFFRHLIFKFKLSFFSLNHLK